jgi:hypothetical protein
MGVVHKLTYHSAYTLEALFSPDTRSSIQPSNPIPECYYSTSQAPIPTKKFRILELGAGTGYVGIGLAAHLRQPCEIYITDLEQVVPLIQENVDKYHNHNASVIADRLHWGNRQDAKRLKKEGFDLVVVSDCVYFPELFGMLLDTLLDVCDAATQVVIGYKCRSLEKETGFWQDYFGRYFEYEPVRKLERIKQDEKEHLALGECLGEEEQLFVFIGKKRGEKDVKKADDTFTTMMFLGIHF